MPSKRLGRKIERQEILLPDFEAVRARHGREIGAAFQADGGMAERGELLEIAPRAAADVQNGEGLLALDRGPAGRRYSG